MSGLTAALGVCTALIAAGCVSAPAATGTTPVPSPAAAASPVASPSAGVTPSAAPSVLPGATAGTPVLPAASSDVSPPQVQVGGVTLSMALQPARRMVPETVVQATDQDSAHQTNAADQQQAALQAMVLDGLLKVTNNLDPLQPAPADDAQSMVRHASIQIRAADGGNPVPYLTVSMDVLLDGRPLTSGLAVVPMIAAESPAPQALYYGNNLKLAQRGTYQFFIRMQQTALLGKDPPQTAEFNVVLR